MIAPAELDSLKGQLFVMPGATVFAVLDGAAVSGLPVVLEHHCPHYACLLRGELQPDMLEVAPYLVLLERNAPFTDWLLLNGWGLNWGIFGSSGSDFGALKRHFRRCVEIEHGGKLFYFRYYDPTVFRIYLATCTTTESKTFFGPVHFFLIEDTELETILTFHLRQEVLQQRAVRLRAASQAVMPDEFWSLAAEPSAEGAGPIALRPEQLKQLGQRIYLGRMRGYLNDVFPETKEMPRNTLEQLIEELTERAAGYKLVLETHIAPFIVAAFVLGMDFDQEYPLALEVLLDYELDSERKAQWLWDFVEVAAGGREEQQ